MEAIQLITREEAAKILHISSKTLGKYKKLGKITPKIIGNKNLYTIDEINRFIKEEI